MWKLFMLRDFPVGHDLCLIENVTYAKMYQECMNSAPVEDLIRCSKNLKRNAFTYLVNAVAKSKRLYCGNLLDNLYLSYLSFGTLGKHDIYIKLLSYAKLFKSYNLDKDYLSLFMLGLIEKLQHKFDQGLEYFQLAMPLNCKYSFECFVEGLQCIKNDEKAQIAWCDEAEKLFPTRVVLIHCWKLILGSEQCSERKMKEALELLGKVSKLVDDQLIIRESDNLYEVDLHNFIAHMLYLARCHMKMNNFTESNKLLMLYLSKQRDSEALIDLASLYLNLDSDFYNPEQAKNLLESSKNIKTPEYCCVERKLNTLKRKRE